MARRQPPASIGSEAARRRRTDACASEAPISLAREAVVHTIETGASARSDAVRPFQVTHGQVFRLAAPMTLAYLSVPLVGVIDTAVIGQLGAPALIGGIAVGAVVLNVLFGMFNFLRSGTTGLSAQAVGADDQTEATAVLARALVIATLTGALVLAFGGLIVEAGSALMDAGPAVDTAMREYLSVRIWASPFSLLNYALLGWLIGLGRSGTALAVQTLFAAANIALSVWFVLGLNLGVAGVAWGSVLAEAVAVAVQLCLALRLSPRKHRPSWARILDRQGFRRLLGVNRDIMIRSVCLLFAFAFFTRQSGQAGEVILAANSLLMHFFVVGGYFLDGFATAAEQLSGRAVGARFRPAFERVVQLTSAWGLGTALLLTGVYALSGPALIDAMTTAPEVRNAARAYLVWAALTPLAGVIAFQMDGIFIGATWSRDMRNMMLLSVVVYLLATFALVPAFGNHGLWAALLIFLGARSLLFHLRMRRLVPRTFPA